jgi:hypothetical protein
MENPTRIEWYLKERNSTNLEGYQKQNGIIREVTIRWRISKDVDKDDEKKIGDLLAWSYDRPKEWLFSVQSSSTGPKEWLFSVQSSSTTTPPDRSPTMEQGYPQATPKEGRCLNLWIDTHLLEVKMKSKDDPLPRQKMTQCQDKRWPSAKSRPRCFGWTLRT